MKLNEKIMNLRKKEGLSQEELAEKLNVTRQTVSKWELGTIIPKMDKLTEMSKVFGITVEMLINEAETEEKEIQDNPMRENEVKKTSENKTKKWPIVVVVILLIILILILIKISAIRSLFDFGLNKGKEGQNMVFDFYNSAMDKMQEIQNTTTNEQKNSYNELKALYDSEVENMKKEQEEEYQKALENQKKYMEQAKEQQKKDTEAGLKASQELVEKMMK